jgi:glycosyltransferase involved in cell wall biosynthesis
VVSYNRASLITHCINRLLNQRYRDYEVILVDDGSTDDTKKLMSKINDVRFNYLINCEKRGQPFSRNKGIKNSKGEIIIFVDSDVLVNRNFIRDHIRLHEKNDKLIVQGMVRHIKRIEDFGKFTLLIDGLCLSGIITQNVSIKRKYLIEVGGFDESFGDTMGYMDVEIGRRLRSLGLKVIYAWKKCRAYHIDGYETEERLKSVFRKSYERGKNAVWFSKMYGSRVAFRHLKKNYVNLITSLFGTHQWVEKKGFKYLLSHRDSFIYPVMKWVMKYHYRAKGIKESFSD